MTTHGMTGTPIYIKWKAMIARCHNPTHKKYADYGGRGIFVAEVWRNDFERFLVDVGEPPPGRWYLDRKDGNKGYEPGNVRWATGLQNSVNRIKRKAGVSQFKGVRPNRRKWEARITRNRVLQCLGLFATEEEAARAYDKAAREFFGEFACPNFPNQ